MLAGKRYLPQAVLDLLRVVLIGNGNCRHSNNGIHRCTDIMAHIGKELAFCLIGKKRLLPCLLQLTDLLPGKLIITDKNSQQRCQNDTAAAQSHNFPLQSQPIDHLIQFSVRHNRYQEPFGIGQFGTIQMTSLLRKMDHCRIICIALHGFPKFPDMLFRQIRAFFKKGTDPLKIIAAKSICAFDDKTPVTANNVGIYQRFFLIQGQHITDIFYGQSCNYRYLTFHPIHRMEERNPQKHNIPSLRILSYCYLLLPLTQRLQKRLCIYYLQLRSIKHVKISILGIQSQIRKTSCHCIIG